MKFLFFLVICGLSTAHPDGQEGNAASSGAGGISTGAQKVGGSYFNFIINANDLAKGQSGGSEKEKESSAGLSKESADSITFDEFKKASNLNGFQSPTMDQFKGFKHGISSIGSIKSKEEAAMALAHFIYQTVGLKTKIFGKCIENGCPGEYEQKDCDKPEKRYFGRGYIHMTYCGNYKMASLALFGDERLVEDPDQVASDEQIAWDTAYWYWDKHAHKAAQSGKFGETTKLLSNECDSPATRKLAKVRFNIYGKVRKAFGLKGEGNEEGCYN